MRDPWFVWDPAAKSVPLVFPQVSKSDNFGEKMKEFMQKYDKNSDGKIEMAEVSPIFPAKSYMGKAIVTWASSMHKHLSRDINEMVVLKHPHPIPST